jgi:hypothetical protein
MEAPSAASEMRIVSATRVNAARQVAVKVIAVQTMEVVEPMAVVKVLEVAEPRVVFNIGRERNGSPRCNGFC